MFIIYKNILKNRKLPKHKSYLSSIIITIFFINLSSLFAQSPGGVAADLTLWLRADENGGITTDNTTITTWQNQANVNFNGTAEGAPIFENDNINNFNFNPYIDFDGSTDAFALAGTPLPNGNSSAELYMVSSPGRSTNNNWVISFGRGSNPGNRWHFGYRANNRISGNWSNGGLNSGNNAFVLDDIYVVHMSYTQGSGRNINLNGVSIASNTNDNLDLDNVLGNAAIGRGGRGGNNFQGRLAEAIVYDAEAGSPTDRQKIESYLAIKYGISLNQNTVTSNDGTGDYLASDGTVVFDAHDGTSANTYNSDIFGIGRDDASDLDQRVAKSVNTGAILTLANDNDFIAANNDGGRTSLGTDKQFLVIANDGGDPTMRTSLESPSGVLGARIDREWKLTNTNGISTISLAFDGFDNLATLVFDDDGDFSGGAQTTIALNSDGEALNIDLTTNTGQFFTLLTQRPFITTWATALDNESITIHTIDSGYNYTINWGDGTIETGQTADATHVYTTAGTYTVSISGDFPRIYFGLHFGDEINIDYPRSERDKLQTIEQWGNIQWTSMENAFNNASNLIYNATDIPDLSGVTSLASMFRSASVFNGAIGNWNVSTITTVSAMFASATNFNQNLSNWERTTPTISTTANMTNMSSLFQNASNYDQPMGNWNTSANTSMGNMFQGTSFNQDISNWNTSQVSSTVNMFNGNTSFNQDISNWDMRRLTSAASMFKDAAAFNADIGNWEVPLLANATSMFQNADAFNRDISLKVGGGNQGGDAWDTQALNNVRLMFADTELFNNGGEALTWNTPALARVQETFTRTVAFNQDVSSWDVSNVVIARQCFANAQAFNQSLATWNLAINPDYFAMLQNCGMDVFNYDATLIGWNSFNIDYSTRGFDHTVNVSGLDYCTPAAITARNAMISRGFIFNGDTENCDLVTLTEILEDSDSTSGNNNGNGTAVTVTQLAALTGITNVIPANEAEYQAAIAAEIGFSNLPTISEVQAIINTVNASEAVLAEVLEDSDSIGGANNANAVAVTVTQLAAIIGITNVIPANEAEYQAAIAAETGFSNPPTLTEVQAIINTINASEAALAEVLEDSDSTGGANNANAVAVTATQLAAIIGITNVIPANEAGYQAVIAAETGFTNPPILTEVQAIIDAVNATATSNGVLAQIGNEGDDPDVIPSVVTVVELEIILPAVTDVIAGNETAYQAYIDANPNLFSSPATQAEVQAMITTVNAAVISNSVLAQIGNEGDNPDVIPSVVTVVELEIILPAVTDVIAGNETAYQAYIDANPNLFSSPATQAEVQAMITTVNAAVSSDSVLAQIGNEGDNPDVIPSVVTVVELETILPAVTDVIAGNETAYQAYIDTNPNLFSSPATQPEVQAMITTVNAAVSSDSVLAQIGNEGDNPDVIPSVVTVAELETIIGISGVDPDSEALYQEYIDINPELFSSPATLEEVQAMIDVINSITTDFDGDGIPNDEDDDDDNDGQSDEDEITCGSNPLDVTDISPDTDNDGLLDCLEDDDNDGLPNNEDPDDNNPDIDEDGIPDGADVDIDGDGVNDNGTDTDGDGINDQSDVDVDGDGTHDNGDDSDGDGINDESDTIDDTPLDSDGDGVVDEDDAFPNNPDESVDADGDGIGANSDFDDNNPNIGEQAPIQNVNTAEAFTPNGDGINDAWVIQGIENYPNNVVRLYNRLGVEVFAANGYQNNWEAFYKNNSRRLPAGSYFYSIQLGNGSAPIQGWLFINY
ncbi:BspA family leucine-rich repeat surface protein [uncultured Croceitalea sp.]|uniref:BspA family leucine-rich repeat surface protein n=1 Tax=uncultured Croceitalea sp. TaxID=1798908 RepID=UPI00374E56C0